MAFEPPWALALILPAALLAWFNRRPAPAPRAEVAFGWLWAETLAEQGWRRHWLRWRQAVSMAADAMALGLLIVALAGPLVPPPRDVVFVIDASLSMAATDVEPTRLDAAKRLAAEWIGAFDSPDRLALVTAGRAAMVVEPLGADRARLAASLRTIEAEAAPARLADAVQLARRMLDGRPGGRVIVLTDQGADARDADAPGADVPDGPDQATPPTAGARRSTRRSAGDAEVEWVRLGRARGNVALTRLAVVPAAAAEGEDRRDSTPAVGRLALVEVTNDSDEPARRRLTLSAPGAADAPVLLDESLELAPNQRWQRVVAIDGPFGAVEASLAPGDVLPADDRARAVLGPVAAPSAAPRLEASSPEPTPRSAPSEVTASAHSPSEATASAAAPPTASASANAASAGTALAEVASAEPPSADDPWADRISPALARRLAAELDRAAESDLRGAPADDATAPRAPGRRWPIRAVLVLSGIVLLVAEWALYQRRWLS